MSLLRKALEGELETPPTTVADPATPALTEGNQPNNQEATVVMTGPLGQAYTQALAVAFAKPTADQLAEGETSQAVSEVAMESQANDAIMAAGAINAVTGAEADAVEDPQALIYGVSAAQLDEKTIVDIASEISQFELDAPEEFVVVVDATDMAQQADAGSVDQAEQVQNADQYLTQPVNEANLDKAELLPVLESMVVAMGGRVVYSLKRALEEIATLQNIEAVEVEEIVEPTGEAIAEAGASVSEPAAEVGEVEPPKDVQAPAEEVKTGVEELPESKEKIEALPVPEAIAPAGAEASEPAVALEAAKPGKKDDKKKEDPKSKLNRAKNIINRVLAKLSDKEQRAELHHAVGIIGSAQKDIK